MTAYDFDESDHLEQLKALGKKVQKAEKAKDPLVKLLKVARVQPTPSQNSWSEADGEITCCRLQGRLWKLAIRPRLLSKQPRTWRRDCLHLIFCTTRTRFAAMKVMTLNSSSVWCLEQMQFSQDVRATLAICFSQLFRVYAPETPFPDDTLPVRGFSLTLAQHSDGCKAASFLACMHACMVSVPDHYSITEELSFC